MTKQKGSVINLLWVLLAFAGMTACHKEPSTEFNQIRMFKPGDIKVTSAETQAVLEWSPSLFTTGRAVKYTVELSQDSTFQVGVTSRIVDTSKITYTDAELAVRQKYYARVKANAYDNIPESGWVRSAAFGISGEQIFLPVLSTDIIDNAVLLKWRTTPALVKIVITPATGAAITIPLTPTDITNEKKLISGLQPSTLYSAEIFDATRSKGFLTFTTKAALTGNLIDLRGITGRPSVLTDTLATIAAGSTVVLRRGETYIVSATANLSKAVKIISGSDLTNPAQATIEMPSNFNIVAGSNIDYIDFEDVYLKGTDYASKYVFNVSNACTIGRISFESCRAEFFRGVARLQTAVINVTDFKVNNCIMDSISNYGIINVDNVNCKVANIALTNSTIYKAEKVVTSRQNSTSVLIDACTFNEAPWGGSTNYLVDYSTSGTNTVSGGITIKNCIFGIAKPNGGNVTTRGIRTNAATPIIATNNYKTTDYLSAGNDIPNLIPYNGSMLTLWQSPLTGNFKIIDNSFAGKATTGDPRWR
ncbi:MAG: hypothetical protein JWP27_2059 [Flaviaesturariibacter sp.]|nr:hypothetical protein [Flaviaesturariibacter sp.]